MGILQLQLVFMFYVTNSWKEILALLLSTLTIYYSSLWYDGVMSDGEYFSFTGLAACGLIFFFVSQSYRKLLDQLSSALDGLKQSKERERLFFASAHHELKTPVHTTNLNLEVLEKRLTKKYSLEPKDKEILSDILDQSKQMKNLIEDILDATSASDKKLKLFKPQTTGIRETLNKTRKSFPYGEKLKLDFDPAFENIQVHTDVIRLTQIFTNIFSNAYKYSPPREKRLKIISENKLKGKKDFYVITFINSIAKNQETSEKFKKISHGLGLKIIEHISARLDFQVICSNEENLFRVSLFIPKTNLAKENKKSDSGANL